MLDNIHRLQEFNAAPDTPFVILMSEVIFLMPVFKWIPAANEWADATGDYDLCMAADGKTMTFINRRATTEKFAYRFISPYWFVSLSGKKKG